MRAPGRICMFGEHSDYLGLPVIPAAIDLSISIEARPRDDSEIHVNYPDIDDSDVFSIDTEVKYRHRRDYLRSAFNLLFRRGIKPDHGWSLRVTGNIPIAAGLSSSSALSVASVMTFSTMAGFELQVQDLAETAYNAEVIEFGESGGMMDHFASAFGRIIHVDCGLSYETKRLPAVVEGLVIGDSLEQKGDTVGDLRRIRTEIENGYNILSNLIPGFDQRTTPRDEVFAVSAENNVESISMAKTTLLNRDITRHAFQLLRTDRPDPREVGNLIDQHHHLLKTVLKRSTPKIERMIDAARAAGALGCKINGSGGGGTMLALAPGKEMEVAQAIRGAGGRPYHVKIGSGAEIEEV
ncbi:MAG: mevalonate kinase family protein [Candidatus Thorarchaeota archaeon SMTZ1-83]